MQHTHKTQAGIFVLQETIRGGEKIYIYTHCFSTLPLQCCDSPQGQGITPQAVCFVPQQETFQTHTQSSSLATASEQRIEQLWQQALSDKFPNARAIKGSLVSTAVPPGKQGAPSGHQQHPPHSSCTAEVAGFNPALFSLSQLFPAQEPQITSGSFPLVAFPHMKAFRSFEHLARYRPIFCFPCADAEAHRSEGHVAGQRGTFRRATGFSEKWLAGQLGR